MKILKDILYKVSLENVKGDTGVSINQVHFDSRKIENNDLFVAIKGTQSDGHNYIKKAIESGAIAIVCEKFPASLNDNITYIQVADSSIALAYIAANNYDNPSCNLNLVGVTGTNGKTTVASLLFQLFEKAGYKVGLISTVKVVVASREYSASHTTPDSLTINRYLKEMSDQGVEYCFMEVSSHGIDQNRIEGLQFKGGVFTNLSHDHLDYHKTFAAYRDVKKRFFDGLSKDAFVITNVDDKNGLVMTQNTKAKVYTYSLKSHSDYKVQILENQFTGLLLKINNQEVWVRLIGSFNAYNLLSIYATAELLGLEKIEILQHLSELKSVSGRFQYFISDTKITAIVDYAHTPDALKNVLQTINDIRTKNEELITVVGAGGDRDKTKRPKMGHIATVLSTKVVLTSDNPRTESPDTILKEIEAGVEPQHYKKLLSILDRKQAIRTACQLANTGDIILIAGKGHETYQEINGERTHFNDFEIVKQTLKTLHK